MQIYYSLPRCLYICVETRGFTWNGYSVLVTVLDAGNFTGTDYCFYNFKQSGRKGARISFYPLALINPYIEWTGYVANVGFALCELILGWKTNKKKAFLRACILGVITVASFGLFSLHYLLRIDSSVFFQALKNRFMVRNVTTSVEMTSVIGGYFKSFCICGSYFWFLQYEMLRLRRA